MSTDRVYNTIAKKKEETVGQTVTGAKVIDNRKFASKKACGSNDQHDVRSEAEVLVSSLQTIPMVNSVTFSKDQYVSVNYLPSMLNDSFKFCVLGNAILRVDTTFELVDGLWLTDTTYTNEALIDLKGKHPEFPGPSFWHFPQDARKLSSFRGRACYTETRASWIEEDCQVALLIYSKMLRPCTAPNICRNETNLSCNPSDTTSGQNKELWRISMDPKVDFRVDFRVD